MTISIAWHALRKMNSESSRDARGIATFNLVTACQEMIKATVRTSCSGLPNYFVSNNKEHMLAACEDAVLNVAGRILSGDSTLTDENPEGFLQSGMIFKCMDFIDDARKGGWATSYRYEDIKENLPKTVPFDLKTCDSSCDERGFEIVEAADAVNSFFTTAMERMIVECTQEESEFNASQIAKTLGCSRTTIGSITDKVAERARRMRSAYAIGV